MHPPRPGRRWLDAWVVVPLVLYGVVSPRLALTGYRGGPADLALPLAGLLLVLHSGIRIASESLLALACTLLLLPSLPFAIDPPQAAVQWLVLAYVACLFALGSELGRRGLGIPALRAFVVGGLLVSTLGLFGVVSQHLVGTSFGFARTYAAIVHGPRAVGPTETPAMLGIFVGSSLVAVLCLLRLRAMSIRRALAFALPMVLALVLARARPLLDLLVAVPLFAWASGVPRERVRLALVLGASAFFVLVLTLVFRFLPLRATPPFVDTHPSLYALCHDLALRAFRAHPITGVGLESFGEAWGSLYEGSRYVSHLEGIAPIDRFGPLDPHSTYLGYLAEAGVFGAAYLVGLGLVLARRIDRRSPELALLFAFAASAGLSLDVATNRGIALLAGLLVGLRARGSGHASPSSQRAVQEEDK